MNSEELKDLVKSHFSLVEANEVEVTTNETFGRIFDENKAFEVIFPGDSLQVGDKVTIETADGQSLDAPDGEHKLEDGTEIVTKDSVVTEIKGADGEKALSEDEEEKTEMAKDDEEKMMEEEVKEDKAVKMEEIIKVIAEKVKDEMKKMETKMEELEDKMSKMSATEAAEPTLTSTGKKVSTNKRGFSAFNMEESLNADRIKMALAELKNKK
jgi:hypothetical protein